METVEINKLMTYVGDKEGYDFRNDAVPFKVGEKYLVKTRDDYDNGSASDCRVVDARGYTTLKDWRAFAEISNNLDDIQYLGLASIHHLLWQILTDDHTYQYWKGKVDSCEDLRPTLQKLESQRREIYNIHKIGEN